MQSKISKTTIILILLFILISVAVMLPKYTSQPPYTIDVCDKMSSNELKIMCYSMFSKDYKYCSLVGTSYPFCIDFVSSSFDLNESFCKSLDSYQKVSCFRSLAIKNKNPNICNLLEDNTSILSCSYSLSSYLDFLKINEDFCNKLSEESLKFICLTKLNKDAKLCENIKQEAFEKGNCLAMATKNTTYCGNTTNYDYCLLLVALETKDFTLCDKIKADISRGECFLQIKEDINYCNNFEGTWKDYCILDYFKLKNLGIIT